jgi:hypothetical protein
MPLPRTRTSGSQDAVLSHQIDNVSLNTERRVMCPINGWVDRIYIARGGAQTPAVTWEFTVGDGTLFTQTAAAGGAAGDVDEFQFGADEHPIAAGQPIFFENQAGTAGTDAGHIFFVIRRR